MQEIRVFRNNDETLIRRQFLNGFMRVGPKDFLTISGKRKTGMNILWANSGKSLMISSSVGCFSEIWPCLYL